MELGTKLSKFEGGEPVDADKYRSLVGSLRYLTSIRPDLSYSVGVESRFMENTKYAHWKALKRILRYVKGTKLLGLISSISKDNTSAFTWDSKKQPIVALSTCEAEYVTASWTVCHTIWLRNLLRELQNPQHSPTEVKVDNKSTIELARNLVHHERSKHIDVHFHFIREHIRNRDVQLTHVMSRDQAANIFTKALPAELFNLCKQKMGMKDARDSMFWAICLGCSNMVDKWALLTAESGAVEVDVWPYIDNLAGDVHLQAAFSSSYEEGQKIFRIQKEQMELMIQLLFILHLPGGRFIPTRANKKFQDNRNKLQALARGIVDKRRKAIEMGEGNTNDLLGILLESNSKQSKENGNGMSIEDVIEECKLFYIAVLEFK
ncbi:retrovirus-related pol polyprotein from transposon TNT 1-94 [Tanacetum coccineum]|uniref:Retrovirus-related pol polyprotein from transposon TNT 1-94 n=1 Tax=Tanacetum coccineum TaxID=301880 RepID=A0ABQ5GF36_9ASTR